MAKLWLDVDALVVESFHTANDGRGAGTVRGAWDIPDAYAAEDSEGSVCASAAQPCTNIPIASCTCGCPEPATNPVPVTPPQPVPATACAATSPCTCRPEMTCSCAIGHEHAHALVW